MIKKNELIIDMFIGFVVALSLSAFIYMHHFGMSSVIFESFFALLGFTFLLQIPKKAVLFTGFFIGILWFYWISYSFKYNGVGFIAPFIVLGFGVVYMLFFSPLAFTTNPFIRALLLLLLSFIEPMGFNWMQLQLPFVHTTFGAHLWQFALILFATAFFIYFRTKLWRFIAFFPLLLAVDHQQHSIPLAPLKIKLVQTDVKQSYKWKKEALQPTIYMVLNEIQNAIEKKYDLVVLPESVLPLFLNKAPKLQERLQQLAQNIDIVIGALYLDGDIHYNVAYHFSKDKYEIAKKTVLVPFGEYIPLPSFLKEMVNDYFFAGASDFTPAKAPTDFNIKGVKFRSAICYEATSKELFKDNPRYMIAISNNAWFAPSIEPTLQQLLMQFYAKRHNTIIYHSANYKGSGIITPNGLK